MSERLRLGIDVRPAAELHRRGIGHYTVEVLTAMMRAHGPRQDWRLLCLGARPEHIPPALLEYARLSHRRVGKLTAHHLAARALRRLDDRFLGTLDAFFVPSAHMLAIDPGVPVVATVHDAFWTTARHLMSRRERVWHRVVAPESLYLRASRLLANSETTASKVRELLPAVADRITVIPHGIDSIYRIPVPAATVERTISRLGLSRRYVLFVGGIEPRKNVRRLIEAFQLARQQGLDHQLVLAGGLSADSEVELRSAPMDDVKVLGYVAERDKPALYTGATAFAIPARDEGFGLPPLEALACGTPSLVSNIAIFRETLGDAALTAEPDDVDALADGLLRLCGDRALRAQILSAGQGRLARYDWGACAEQTYQAIVAAATG